MSRTACARVAGFTFLFYIVIYMVSINLVARATSGHGLAEKLAGIARHAVDLRAVVLLSLLQCLAALVLGVTLYALTRDAGPELAMLAMICRVVEGISGVFVQSTLGLLWLATAGQAAVPDTAAAQLLGGFLLRMDAWNPGGVFFAVGSTLFAWLLLRGRTIPAPLAWLGVIASLVLLVTLPAQLTGHFGGVVDWNGPIVWVMWLPMLVFETSLAFWLLATGARRSSVAGRAAR